LDKIMAEPHSLPELSEQEDPLVLASSQNTIKFAPSPSVQVPTENCMEFNLAVAIVTCRAERLAKKHPEKPVGLHMRKNTSRTCDKSI
jgi:hypothetical protein